MNNLTPENVKRIIEAAIIAAPGPINIDQLLNLFATEYPLKRQQIEEIIKILAEEYQDRGVILKEVASGYRFQIAEDLAPWIQRLWSEKPVKYSRALLETLALIVYKQPITRAEIEEVRGVVVSTTIIKTLLERQWIRIVGYKEVPGKPALYATTKAFLDDFNVTNLSELPSLSEIKNIDQLAENLALAM